MQSTGPAGRPPARRRAGAIAALTGIAVLLHAALLSELRWTWPAPPAPFGALQVRAIAPPSSSEPATGVAPESRLDAGVRIESTAATATRDGDLGVAGALRFADAHPVTPAVRRTPAPRPVVPSAQRERARGSERAAIDVASEASLADPSDRDRRGHAALSGGPPTASGAAVSAAPLAAEIPVAEALAPDPAQPAMAPAQASAAAWQEPDSIPLYRTRMPPSATLRFAMRVAGAAGAAELRWRPDGAAYALRFEGRVEGGPTATQASDGGFDGAGLAPVRHTDARTRRGMLATNFQRDAGRISFSGSRALVVLARGSQDRLSWMVQLAAVLAAEPALRLPGAVVAIPVAGLRGEAAVWRFRIVAAESAGEPAAAGPLVRLVRDRQGPYDVDIEVALDPGRHFLPATLGLRTANGVPTLELTLREAVFEP